MSNFNIQGALVLSSPLPTPINTGHYLRGKEREKRFVNVHLQCIVSNLKNMRKMSMLEKILLTPPGKVFANAMVLSISQQYLLI